MLHLGSTGRLALSSGKKRSLKIFISSRKLGSTDCCSRALQFMVHSGSRGWNTTCRNLVYTSCCSRALQPMVQLGSTSWIPSCRILSFTGCCSRALQSVLHLGCTGSLVLSRSKNYLCPVGTYRNLNCTNTVDSRSAGWNTTWRTVKKYESKSPYNAKKSWTR